MPERIRLSRAAGWRKPANAVVVSRPSRWGNPFLVEARRPGPGYAVVEHRTGQASRLWRTTRDRATAHALSVELYALHTGPFGLYEPDNPAEWLESLRGKDLACWCPPEVACHADHLIAWCLEVFGAA